MNLALGLCSKIDRRQVLRGQHGFLQVLASLKWRATSLPFRIASATSASLHGHTRLRVWLRLNFEDAVERRLGCANGEAPETVTVARLD